MAGRNKKLPATKAEELDRTQRDTKKKRQINRTIINALLGDEDAPHGMQKSGLIEKSLRILNRDLQSGDSEQEHRAIDKITKLLPYVLAKESNPITNIYNNNQKINNNIGGGDLQTLEAYINNRHKQKLVTDNLKTPDADDAQIIEENNHGTESEIEETGGAPDVEEQPVKTPAEIEIEERTKVWESEVEEDPNQE